MFEEPIKPKHHISTHHPSCIGKMGPLKYLSCAKWESFHKLSKAYAKVVHCRINLLYSLSTKLQLNLAYKFYSGRGFVTLVEVIPHSDNKNKNVYKSITISKTPYKINDIIHLPNNTSGDPVFGVICSIIGLGKKNCFRCKRMRNSRFD